MILAHVIRSVHGNCLVDRWPSPRTVLAQVADAITLRGDPEYLGESGRDTLTGFVDDAGRRPSWTTSPDNAGSLGVARRLGFRQVREVVSYLVRTPVP